MTILNQGSCEPIKATVHGAALGLAALMGLYNAAAWLRRRERHLAVNTVLYGMAIAWEHRHVAHHLAACRRVGAAPILAMASVVSEVTEVRDIGDIRDLAEIRKVA